MPCKTRVAELVDELSDAAKLIGACNTVVVKDGKLYGNNTDGMGFVRNLKENGVDVKGKKNHRDGCRRCGNRNSGAVCIGWRKENFHLQQKKMNFTQTAKKQ